MSRGARLGEQEPHDGYSLSSGHSGRSLAMLPYSHSLRSFRLEGGPEGVDRVVRHDRKERKTLILLPWALLTGFLGCLLSSQLILQDYIVVFMIIFSV